MDIFEIRRANLRKLSTQWGGPTTLSKRLGYSNGSFIAQLAGPHPSREVSEKVARGIEATLALPTGWLDGVKPDRPPIDDDTLAQSVRAVAVAVEASKTKPSPDQFAELVAMTYEHSVTHGGCDESYINRLVRLLK
ncbi:hypothetical protein UFOVP61_15 [uncultured Caudovirales phage]|uniref:Uncharacterized protein n=1 Tax=uncultured Caudovirales phage TaxID=2100421 RepID=A0A6J5KTT7_9CAUD|nr:hypothetical protein UFOVP61_15 [uncultured Caudovirales phage]